MCSVDMVVYGYGRMWIYASGYVRLEKLGYGNVDMCRLQIWELVDMGAYGYGDLWIWEFMDMVKFKYQI